MEASARCGIVFQSSCNDMIELNINGSVLDFEKLEILEFTSGSYSSLLRAEELYR